MPNAFNLTPFNRRFSSERKYHTEKIEYTGFFNPGDTIEIDCENLIVTQNGQNISHLFEGDFFNLNFGENIITWADTVDNRYVNIHIMYTQ